jgi:hypothetical protein
MRRGGVISLGLASVALAVFAAAQATGATGIVKDEPEAVEGGFRLHGTHGYSIAVAAYALGEDQRGSIEITVSRHQETVSYTAPATVSPSELRADLGPLGRMDLIRIPSGRKKTVHPKCLGGPQTYEPGTYEGSVEFTGEHGYTRAVESRVAAIPVWLLFTTSGACGSGGGEATGPGEAGARLRGISFAHDRSLSFQINKNRSTAKTIFTASLKERRHGIRIYRQLAGVAPPNAFRFNRFLRSSTLSPPRPFTGTASLRRTENSTAPTWTGDLSLSFPGRPLVPIAGNSVHVSLVHAHFTKSNGPHAEIGFGP